MPLLCIRQVASDVVLGLWRMDEDSNDYSSILEHLGVKCKSNKRKQEIVCVHLLLQTLIHNNKSYITHNKQGKPILDNPYNLSISHTKGYCAIILSKTKEVAVDLEYTSDRIMKIRSKFLFHGETAVEATQALLYWCAKETMYKYYSEKDLQYDEIFIHPFILQKNAIITAELLKEKVCLPIHYERTDDYILTYAYSKE